MTIVLFTTALKSGPPVDECSYNKDSIVVLMRMERKVKPADVVFLKKSFYFSKAEVLVKEPGCPDYLLFKSYNESKLFCLTEAWATKSTHNSHMLLEHTKKHKAETIDIYDPSYKSKTNNTYCICPGANKK